MLEKLKQLQETIEPYEPYEHTECFACFERDMAIDMVKTCLESIVGMLYSSQPLYQQDLDIRVREACHYLGVYMPKSELQVERLKLEYEDFQDEFFALIN